MRLAHTNSSVRSWLQWEWQDVYRLKLGLTRASYFEQIQRNSKAGVAMQRISDRKQVEIGQAYVSTTHMGQARLVMSLAICR